MRLWASWLITVVGGISAAAAFYAFLPGDLRSDVDAVLAGLKRSAEHGPATVGQGEGADRKGTASMGLPGPKGDPGERGPQGPQGPPGPPGVQGVQGESSDLRGAADRRVPRARLASKARLVRAVRSVLGARLVPRVKLDLRASRVTPALQVPRVKPDLKAPRARRASRDRRASLELRGRQGRRAARAFHCAC